MFKHINSNDKKDDMKHLEVPRYKELSVHNIWFLVIEVPDLNQYFSKLQLIQLPDRNYIFETFNILEMTN